MRELIKKMLSSDSSVSSKRVIGCFGFIVCSGIFIYKSIVLDDISGLFNMYLACSASLIGLESIVTIFKK